MSKGGRYVWVYTGHLARRRGSLSSEWKRYKIWKGRFKILLDAKRGSGYLLVGWVRPDRSEVERWSVQEWKKGRRMKKKKAVGATPTAKHLAPMETIILRDHLPILEHCAMTQYEDGDPRKPGWITLKTFGSTWQFEVKDPDTLQMMRVAAPTFDEAVVLLGLLLGSEDAPWEPDVWAQQQAKKSKK